MSNIENAKGWIIFEAGTGLMDGIYFDKEMAENVMEFIHETAPHRTHFLLAIESKMEKMRTDREEEYINSMIKEQIIPEKLIWSTAYYEPLHMPEKLS